MPYVFEKHINSMGIDVDVWKLTEIFLKLLRYLEYSSSL